MKSIPKLIRRFVGVLLFSSILLIFLNVVLLVIITYHQMPNASPWNTAEETAAAIKYTDNGYALPEDISTDLTSQGIWAILIDNDTLNVVWHTEGLPDTIPTKYTIADISSLTRGYIDGYPTFTGGTENGLLVLGYPKESFWKHLWASWDYQLIANAPKIGLSVIAINIAVIFLIYVIVNTKLLKSIKPITNGIQALPTGEPVHVRESGLLSEVAVHINKTSEILQHQEHQLKKKETARANWIAGVSHDIRTPLSMVMGYAGQLQDDTALNENQRQKAELIVRHSERIRNLISDLNLASNLEYNMQPIQMKPENMVAVIRQTTVEFINLNMDGKHEITWLTDNSVRNCLVEMDKDLIKRAVGNLIQNAINHNENGCHITINITYDDLFCTVTVSDNGIGASKELIERLNNMPHYMICDENTNEQRHGLGLLIVKQIVDAHHGEVVISESSCGGFEVSLKFPLLS